MPMIKLRHQRRLVDHIRLQHVYAIWYYKIITKAIARNLLGFSRPFRPFPFPSLPRPDFYTIQKII